MADATIRGQFVWHDLMTPNAAGAHEFYGNVLGWKKQSWEQDPSYEMFAADSGPIGGSVEARAQTPHWLTYIGTADIDGAVETATGLGARIVSPLDALPNGGRYATLADPQGAVFGVYSSNAPPDSDRAAQPGEFSWHELATSVAPSVAFEFYSRLFAWDEISQYDMGPMGTYLIFGRNGKQLGGMFDQSSQGKSGNAYWLGYVSVTDLDGTVERAKAARGSVLIGPMDVPGGDRIAQLMDPHGAFFALHMAAEVSAPPKAAAPPAKARAPAKAAKPKKAAAAPAPSRPSKPARKAAAKKAAARKKPATKKRPAKKTAAKNKKPAARKAAKKKSPAKKATSRTTGKKAKRKAKTRKRGR